MAGQILIPHSTGATLYAVVRDLDGAVWNPSSTALEAYSSGTYTSYPIALAEQGGSGLYAGAMPSAANGSFLAIAYAQAGGGPAEGDAVVGSFRFDLRSSSYVTPRHLAAQESLEVVEASVEELLERVPESVDDIADAILDRASGVEPSYTVRKALRIMLAVLAGRLTLNTGMGTVTIRDVNDTTNRVVANVDGSGNRSSLTLNGD